ncbi:MAG: beta-ketoacyl-[acyl-carrier-protein] synthase family protein [Marinilabiliaceae bacterium]|nr:beta-ketoacyl-[acyl-carrier-protein] synthase family protein [Marinilabiliaceae bacterium]
MNQSVVVTGIGVVSSIGLDAQLCFKSLLVKQSGIAPIRYLETVHKNEFILGEVKLSNKEMESYLGISFANNNKYSRTTLLAIIAAREAYEMAVNANGQKNRVGIVSSTTVGGMDITERCFLNETDDYSFLLTHPCGDSTKQVADYLSVNTYYTTLNTACSSGTNALIHGARLIKHGLLDRVIVGGVDALTMFTLNGFNSLMILDKEPCKPFDLNRNGLNLAEGAGYLVLERKSEVSSFLCHLAGYENANDAYHQTASSPSGDGAFMSMMGALNMAKLNPDDVDYINVHGTGTINNDLSEGTAMIRLFGKDKVPVFSSTKSYTGHTLAASAGIEAVFSVMAITEDVVYPNLNFNKPIEELGLIPNCEVLRGKRIKNVMSNSFGFGGNNSTVIFSK